MSQDIRECDAGSFTFEQWKKEVDRILVATEIGLPSNCLVDIAYWDLWAAGAEPCEAAQEVLWAEYGGNAPVCKEYLVLYGEM